MSLIVLALFGCTQVERDFSDVFSAQGVSGLLSEQRRGDFSYQGAREDAFEVSGRSWALGSKSKAEEREAGNDWSYGLDNTRLVLSSSSEARMAGVDFVVNGPAVLDLDVSVGSGTVSLTRVEGIQFVRAGGFVGSDLVGDLDLVTDQDGASVSLWPFERGVVRIDTEGDTQLSLPYGLDYEIEVEGDPGYEMLVTDLGFDTTYLSEGYFSGSTGGADILVAVTVRRGSFELRER